jgi:hypothetical protein
MKRMRVRLSTLLGAIAALSMPAGARATGEDACVPTTHNFFASEARAFSATEIGTRATIEGQSLPKCTWTVTAYPSGSFHWVSVVDPYNGSANNIVQVGYGTCVRADNFLGLGTLCNGNYYWYWAWGSDCGGTVNGTGPGIGPVPIRIGAALTDPPPTRDIYVLRHVVNGVSRYEGYVNGSLLTGTDALGNTVSASVPASSVCWNSDNTTGLSGSTTVGRATVWFGETFNSGDSLGGWIGGVEHHLDYSSSQYSVATGWLDPGIANPADCLQQFNYPPYRCKLTASDQFYVQTYR